MILFIKGFTMRWLNIKHFIFILLLVTMTLLAVSQAYLWSDTIALHERNREINEWVWALVENESRMQNNLTQAKAELYNAIDKVDRDNESRFDLTNKRINSVINICKDDVKKLNENLSADIDIVSNELTETVLELDNKEDLIRNQISENLPSVVHIFCYNESGSWQGSGVIISEDGLVVTAAHVIGYPGQTYTITMNDGKQYITTKACYLENYDVGFIKINAKGLPISEFGNFEDMGLGDPIYSIGSPWGVIHFNSVTKGIVSSLNRTIYELYGWEVLFQTDCPGNPGSSGCPVYNSNGKIVGILVGAYTSGGGYDGITFCVPSTIVLEYKDEVYKMFQIVENTEGIIF